MVNKDLPQGLNNEESSSVVMSDNSNPSAPVVDLEFNNFGAKLLNTLFAKQKKVTCRVWSYPNGMEVCIGKKTVKLGTQQFELGNRLFNIDYSAIQLIEGKLVYNTHYNNAVGALRFQKPLKDVDAKNAKELLQRNWLTALWGSWKMPLLIALIAVGISIALATVVATMFPQLMRAQERVESLQAQLDMYRGIPIPAQPQQEVVR